LYILLFLRLSHCVSPFWPPIGQPTFIRIGPEPTVHIKTWTVWLQQPINGLCNQTDEFGSFGIEFGHGTTRSALPRWGGAHARSDSFKIWVIEILCWKESKWTI